MAEDFDPEEREVLGAIAAAPVAWSASGAIGREGAVAGLVRRGVVERWPDCPEGEALTLTPYGAATLRLAIAERWAFEARKERQWAGRRSVQGRDGLGEPTWRMEDRYREVTVREGYEVPYWASADVEPGPTVLPKHAREVPLDFPERVPDHWSEILEEGLDDGLVDPATGRLLVESPTGPGPLVLLKMVVAVSEPGSRRKRRRKLLERLGRDAAEVRGELKGGTGR